MDYSLQELQHAYQVLGASADASALAIKHAYRRLVKRWHPDLYADGTPAHAEAVQMTKLINEAFAAIAHAPLRYRAEIYARQPPPPGTGQSYPAGVTESPDSGKPLNTDRIEYWVRFVCGTAVGVSASLEFIVFWSPFNSAVHLSSLILAATGVVLLFGLSAARYGDKFWHWILRLWWLWG